jgi:hypothetical protein
VDGTLTTLHNVLSRDLTILQQPENVPKAVDLIRRQAAEIRLQDQRTFLVGERGIDPM